MELLGQLKRNYRARYYNTERQLADIQPGENVLKYIQDCFETAAKEDPELSPSLSTSSCSSPDLNQDPPPSEKKKSLSSVLVNSARTAFSTPRSKAPPEEACSSGGRVFLSDSSDEDELPLGAPSLLFEEAHPDPEATAPDQNGSPSVSSKSQSQPPPLPWTQAGSEPESEGQFLIEESFGGPSSSWLLQPPKNHLSKGKSPPAPQLESEKATQEPSVDNVCGGAPVPVAGQGDSSSSKQPPSLVPAAQQSPTRKQMKKRKHPKNASLKKQAQREKKMVESPSRDAGKKRRVLVLEEEGPEKEPKKLCSKEAAGSPGDRLTPLAKRSAQVRQTLSGPEEECSRALLAQEGPCEAGEASPRTARPKSRALSERYPFVRAINRNDLSGPVYNQNYKVSFEHENMVRGNMGDSLVEPPVATEEDEVSLPSNSLKDKAGKGLITVLSFPPCVTITSYEPPVISAANNWASEKSTDLKNRAGGIKGRPQPDNITCLRQSKRLRLKPLEYWRGERVKYKMLPSGGLVASGIISPKLKEPNKLNRRKQPTKLDLEKMLEKTNAALKDPSQPAQVFDAASKQEVFQECVSSGRSHLLFFSNQDVSIYKYFSTPLFSAGKLILNPLKEKGSQYSQTDTLVFHLVKGRILFTLYCQCYSLCAGSYFCVPAGNIYNIQNILNEECILFFTQIKGNRSKGE